MSLFHVTEWYNSIFPTASSMAVAQLIEDRDQLVVGSFEGTLTVIDPGGNVEQRHEMAVVVEYTLKEAILQVTAGKFLTSYDQALIVVLHPHSLVYFRLTSNDEESFLLEQVFEHRIQGDPAFNMCQGRFGRSHVEQICIQSIGCTLSVFEGENRVLGRQLTDAIHPGPIGYTAFSESILLTSGGYLTSVRYSVLTSNSSLNHQLPPSSGGGRSVTKKLNADWSLNLGDTALDLSVIGVMPIQPSIVVLCKRAVFCVTHGGVIRFVIRLQCVASCMMVSHANKEAEIQICVGVSSKTLLFYHDTKMVWSAQLSFVPTYVNIANFTESLRCLLTLLSDDSRVFVGYLGTEPSLFRMPVTESRYIDFEARKRQLREFEEIIWKSGRENLKGQSDENLLQMTVELNMDEKSMAYDVNVENIPSATVILNISGVKDKVDVIFQGDIFAHKTNFSFTSRETGSVPIIMFCKNAPTLDLRCQIAVISNTAEVLTETIILPIRLVCHQTTAQKAATYKLSLDSSQPCLGISQLFPEFVQENDTALGLQQHFSDTVTSIFISLKTNRYRIQSNSTDFLFVVLSELIRRIRLKQPDVRFHCPAPLHMFLNVITSHLEAEGRRDALEREISRIAIQMRQSETVLLGKLKSDREPFTSHVSALINYTYREMMTALDELTAIDAYLKSGGYRSLRALLNLMSAVLDLSPSLHLPFDGRILDGADMKLGDLIMRLLGSDDSPSQTTDITGVDAAENKPINTDEVGRMIIAYCEKSSTAAAAVFSSEDVLTDVLEEEENTEEDLEKESNDRFQNKEEFFELKSGSLPANFITKTT